MPTPTSALVAADRIAPLSAGDVGPDGDPAPPALPSSDPPEIRLVPLEEEIEPARLAPVRKKVEPVSAGSAAKEIGLVPVAADAVSPRPPAVRAKVEPIAADPAVTEAVCPACRHRGTVPARFAGKEVKCRECGFRFLVAGPASPEGPRPEPENHAVPEVDDPPSQDDEPEPEFRPRRRLGQKKAKKAKRRQPIAIIALASVGVGALIIGAIVGALALGGVFKSHLDAGPTFAGNRAGQSSRPVLPAANAARKPGFGDWLQDLTVARAQAVREQKDILILFDGSDWCGWSIRFAKEVLFEPEFAEQVRQKFVLVLIDFPRGDRAQAQVEDPERNRKLQEEMGIQGYPTVVLADAQGRVYASEGYQSGGASKYLDRLAKLQEIRIRRDELIAAVEKATGAAKLPAARAALEYLSARGMLAPSYRGLIDSWHALARQHDPKNEQGYLEVFFEFTWLQEASLLSREDPVGLRAWARRLDEFKQASPFKDVNVAARLHLIAAFALARAGRKEDARRYITDAAAYQPTDKDLQQLVHSSVAVLGDASGTGFVVAPGGLILTNAHVVEGSGRISVRLPGATQALPAEVVARDSERDLALLRVTAAEAKDLKPLAIDSAQPVNRGESVAALGYPLGDAVGSGLKLTAGVISGIPENGTGQMLVLDAKVNPGNSGGPLCSTAGTVVGMVTAKSRGGLAIESYGMALPAADLVRFLQKHVPAYKPASAPRRVMPWDEVDRLVSPSVVMVLNARP